MASTLAANNPVEAIRKWLTNDWDGPLRPVDVIAVRGEDAEEREAWFLTLLFPSPTGETWDAVQFAELQRAIRDKALEVGLPYPWYVIPRAVDVEEEPIPEDDMDLPDEG